jgi:uncharacterized protein YbaR (Trm112 family)
MVIGGENAEDYIAFEEDVSREIRLAAMGCKVLETGCGPGNEAIRFLTEFGAKQVIATDISFGMLQAARKKYPQIMLVQADARYLPFGENAVDVVYSNCMYHHIEVRDRGLVLEESLRVSRQSVLLNEIAGFQDRLVNLLYRLYYSVVDGSADRPSVERWLEFLGSRVRRYLRRPERALVFRYVLFVLDSSRKEDVKREPSRAQARGQIDLTRGSANVDEELLGILACPRCKTRLTLNKEKQALKCDQCCRTYIIRDNIPVLLMDQARIEET